MIQKKIFSRITSPLVFIAVLMFVTLSASCKTEDEKKLEALFANGNYPFTNVQGEAPELADFILKIKRSPAALGGRRKAAKIPESIYRQAKIIFGRLFCLFYLLTLVAAYDIIGMKALERSSATDRAGNFFEKCEVH